MDLSLSETQQLVRDAVRDYLAREVSFDRVREIERSGGHDEPLWRALQELGWLGLVLPEDVGGGGGSCSDVAIVLEELSRRAVIIPFMEAMVAARTIHRFGAPEAQRILAAVLEGKAIITPALLEESDRYDDVKATVQNGKLSGEKYFVDYGQVATHHLVAATRNGAIELFLVDAHGPGVTIEPLRSISRTPSARVRFDGAAATPVCGADGHRDLIQLGRALAAVQCLGCAQQALDMTVEYVSHRVQFGQPIGAFQAVQHHCANMATLVEATRFLVYEAMSAIDSDTATERQIAIAKASASRTVSEVTMMAHQLHGGIGIVEEYDLYFFSLRGKERALAWGSAEECLAIVAAHIEEPEDWLPIGSAAAGRHE